MRFAYVVKERFAERGKPANTYTQCKYGSFSNEKAMKKTVELSDRHEKKANDLGFEINKIRLYDDPDCKNYVGISCETKFGTTMYIIDKIVFDDEEDDENE